MKKALIFLYVFICFSSILFSQQLTLVRPKRFYQDVVVDIEFANYIKFMGECADKHNLDIFVTGGGFRKEGASLTNTVVEPAKFSNHFVGHAIDININYNRKSYNNTELGNFSTLPQPIKDFINECKKYGIRWGGDFTKDKDPVHFDSNLYLKNPSKWKKLYDIYQNQSEDLTIGDISDIIDMIYLTGGKKPSDYSVKFKLETFTIGTNKWETFTMKNGYKIKCRIYSYGLGDLHLEIINLSPFPILFYWEVNGVGISPLDGYGYNSLAGINGNKYNFSEFKITGKRPQYFGAKITVMKK